MGSLTNQLLKLLNTKDFDTVCTQIEEHRGEEHHPSLQFILQILHLVCKMFDQIFICLDAIDELETVTQTQLMKSIQDIISMSCNLSTDPSAPGAIFLFLTARPQAKDMITQALGNQARSGSYLRTVIITAHDDDIREYILHQVNIDPSRGLMNNVLRQQLLTEVPKNSQGM